MMSLYNSVVLKNKSRNGLCIFRARDQVLNLLTTCIMIFTLPNYRNQKIIVTTNQIAPFLKHKSLDTNLYK